MNDVLNIAIIGGGIVGCCVAWELSKTQAGIFVFEKNPGITKGENQSSRNSGVNHAGINYDRKTRPLKARLCVEGNRLWYDFCERYQVPCQKTGKLIVAQDAVQNRGLDRYLRRAAENGVADVRKISGEEVQDLEPNVKAHAALFVPTSGIFEPTALLHQVYALASNQGVEFMTATEIVALAAVAGGLRLTLCYRDGRQDSIVARRVINAAGVHAVGVARLIDPDFPIQAALTRGDSLKFYRKRRADIYLRGMNVYPAPIVVDTPTGRHHSVGVHLTPTFDRVGAEFVIGDTVTVGPKLIPVKSLEDYQTPVPPVESFLEDLSFFPGLTSADLESHQCGVHARLNGYPDFYIQADRTYGNVIHLLGIDSPGFTAAPAIARYVARLIDKQMIQQGA
ncbi:MAG: FAD-dependent oxidoreductase [Desulfobacterales bacterium]|nr:MAG: FAD-dependent oxidoreductase [Desulfobacterales bacterium]